MSQSPEQLPLGESIETDPDVVVVRRCFLTVAATALLGSRGADVHRVHDAGAARRALQVAAAIEHGTREVRA